MSYPIIYVFDVIVLAVGIGALIGWSFGVRR